MKRKDECLFCRNRFCYERVVSIDYSYDEIACRKHIKDLHKHSDEKAPGVMKHFITSTGKMSRDKEFKI